MKKLLTLFLFLPVFLFADALPCPLSLPVVYDLTGAIDEGYSVVAVVTDQAEISEFSFDSETDYLTLLTDAQFYYALCLDSAGHQQFLYMGPQEVGEAAVIQEIEPLPSSLGEGAKAAGKGALISLGSGTGIFLIAVAADTGDGWTAIAGLVIGIAVAYVGILTSAAWGIVKGVQVSMQNQKEIARRRQNVGYGSSSSTYIVSLVEREIVPAEYLEQLDTRI